MLKAGVGLLGMAFKADIDDTRASLSYKLKKSLLICCREVLTADPFVTTDPELIPTAELVARSDSAQVEQMPVRQDRRIQPDSLGRVGEIDSQSAPIPDVSRLVIRHTLQAGIRLRQRHHQRIGRGAKIGA